MLVFVLPFAVVAGTLGAGFLAKSASIAVAGAFMEKRTRDAVDAVRSGRFFDAAQLEDGTLIPGDIATDEGVTTILLTEQEWTEAAGASPQVPEQARTTFERYEELMEIGMTRAGFAAQQ